MRESPRLISAFFFYFCALASFSSKAAMVAIVAAIGAPNNRAFGVGRMAAYKQSGAAHA